MPKVVRGLQSGDFVDAFVSAKSEARSREGVLLVMSAFYCVKKKFVSRFFDGGMCFVSKLSRQSLLILIVLNMLMLMLGDTGEAIIT